MSEQPPKKPDYRPNQQLTLAIYVLLWSATILTGMVLLSVGYSQALVSGCASCGPTGTLNVP